MKICINCYKSLELSFFTKKSKNNDGLQRWCKPCDKIKKNKYPSQDKLNIKEYNASKYIEQKDSRSHKAKIYYTENRADILSRVKSNSENTKASKSEYDKIYREKNKKKIADYKKEYAKENAIDIAAKQREYREYNVEKLAISKSHYAKNNRASINKRASIYIKNRCDIDPLFRLIKNTRKMVSRYMLGEKSKRTYEIIGCSYIELQHYIESKFTEGMDWNNYGINGWHIDHIKPLACANTKEEVMILNHYTNLQPLWALDNLKKGSTFEGFDYKG